MIDLSIINKEALFEWNKTTYTYLFLISEDMRILEYSENFKIYENKFKNIYKLITYTHRSKFSYFLLSCIKEKSIISFLTNFSYDNSDVEDIPNSFNITMQYIKENEILLIAEPIFPLFRKDAKEYFSMINEYSSVSRKLQKSEFNLNKKNLELSSKIKELEYLINYDSLTNIYSRQRILEELEKEYKRYKRLNETFTIAMIDIDLFKNVNDKYGHQNGDVVLKIFASIIKSMCREYDSIGRFGGEEFLFIFPSTKMADAKLLLSRMLEFINNKQIELSDNVKVIITFSAGLAEINPNDTINNLISRSDIQLYKAKDLGRNQIA